MEKFMTFLGFAEEVDEDGTEGAESASPARRSPVFSLHAQRQWEIIVIEPRSLEDARRGGWGGGRGRAGRRDQPRLPGETTVRTCRTWEDVADAIRRLQVRGAPAIGVAAASALVLAGQAETPDAAPTALWRAAGGVGGT